MTAATRSAGTPTLDVVKRAESEGTSRGVRGRLRTLRKRLGTHGHAHSSDTRGLAGITLFAFALGFAHNEEFEIIAICTGSTHCLELMLVYALAVLLAVVVMTILLVAGYEHFEDRVEAHRDLLPTVTAAVLVVMGLGFIFGLV